MSKTIPPRTKRAIEKRQKNDYCRDCGRYKAFCDERHQFEDDGEYWVCDECMQAGRPDQEDSTEQQSLLQYSGDGR